VRFKAACARLASSLAGCFLTQCAEPSYRSISSAWICSSALGSGSEPTTCYCQHLSETRCLGSVCDWFATFSSAAGIPGAGGAPLIMMTP
jgi:hypothetical protein